ncbi:MAG: DUF1559 domain-containing protein [Aureliella sp.]
MSNGYEQFSSPEPPVQKQNTGLIIAIVLAVAAVPVLLVCAGILVGLLLPAVQAAREAARRVECSNNLKNISIALLNYEDYYRALPPAYTTDESGRRLHSWRTLILPQLGHTALYNSIDLSKPWDDPVNQQAAATVIPEYVCPSSGPNAAPNTVYQAVVDPASAFPGSQSVKLRDVTDGLSNTVFVIETAAEESVPWMSPQDSDMPSFVSPGNTHHTGGINCAMGDGSVHFLSNSVDATTRQGLVTRNGGETINIQ